MKTLEKIAKVGFVALMAAGLAGCGKITGKVVSYTGNRVNEIESYYSIGQDCMDLKGASNEVIQKCRSFNSKMYLEPGDYTLQVEADDGTLYSLDVFGCVWGNTYPTGEDMVQIHSKVLNWHNVKFPKNTTFNRYNVGDVNWCDLKFFEDEEGQDSN